MNQNMHAINLGKLISNVLTIEFLIRLYLARKNGEEKDIPKELLALREGQIVSKNSFTDKTYFGDLINEYNSECDKEDLIKDEIISLRNALAHGRVLSDLPDSAMQLIHFNTTRNQYKMRVDFAATMSKEWFTESIEYTRNAVNRIRDAIRELLRIWRINHLPRTHNFSYPL